VYFVGETVCWNESVSCLTLKIMMSTCGRFKENEGSLLKNQKMLYVEGINKVCLFELTGEKRNLINTNIEMQVQVRGGFLK